MTADHNIRRQRIAGRKTEETPMKTAILATVATLALGGVAFAQSSDNSTSSNDDTHQGNLPEVSVGTAKIEGNKITGVSVWTPQPGYLVIHNDADGKPPASLGHIAVPKGKSANVTIDATETLDPASNVTVMLHYETNGNTTYDFGPGSTDVDTPAMGAGDTVVNVPMNQ
jgi:hypothetical protein